MVVSTAVIRTPVAITASAQPGDPRRLEDVIAGISSAYRISLGQLRDAGGNPNLGSRSSYGARPGSRVAI